LPARDLGIAKSGKILNIHNNLLGVVRVETNGRAVIMNAAAYDRFQRQNKAFGILQTPKNSRILEGKTAFLDPGHGVGAPGGTQLNGIYEHEVVLKYAFLLKSALEKKGATVVMTRTDENDVDNYVRMAMINKYSMDELANHYAALDRDRKVIAEVKSLSNHMQRVIDDKDLAGEYFDSPYDERKQTKIKPVLNKIFEYQKDPFFNNFIFISVHHNGPGSHGAFTYAMSNLENPVYYDEYNEGSINALAVRLECALISGGGFVNRGIKYNDFFMLRETNIVSGLLEIAYLFNEYDRIRLLDPDIMQKIADHLTQAVESYFLDRI
jgi:N-acetylmuramoyl-L-alanine amidase